MTVAAETSRRYEKTLIAILFFTWGTVFLDRMSQLYLSPFIAPEFHLTHQQVGALASALGIGWAFSTLVFGALSDRFGRRVVLLPFVFLFSILSWISGLAHTYHQLLLVRALMGIAEGPTWSIMTAIIEESSEKSRRGRNVGLVVSAAALVGLALAPILSTQVAARSSWRWAFFAAGVPGILMGGLIWKYIKEPGKLPSAEVHAKPSLAGYFSILRYRNIWLCSIAATGFMCWLFLLNVFAPQYITQVVRQQATTAGFLLGAGGLGSFFIGFIFPAISDRIGRKPVLLLLAALSTLTPLALLCSFLYQHLWLLALILLVTNGGQGLASLIMVLVPTESVPIEYAATSIGLATLTGEIFGATAAPALAGAFADKYGLGITMWMSAAGTVLIFLVALLVKPTATRPYA
jgi:MFS family permease